jgi:phage terminase Nu1 subunit (DNA packaging protein)
MTRARNLQTRGELAEALGCSVRTISTWQGEGLPVAVRGKGGRASLFDPAACRRWVETREEARANSQPVDVARARARREEAQALLAEQLHATRAGRLLPADDVAGVWSRHVAAVRAAILATYTTAADRVHRAATIEGLAGVEREMKTIAFELLRELAATDERSSPPRKRSKVARRPHAQAVDRAIFGTHKNPGRPTPADDA